MASINRADLIERVKRKLKKGKKAKVTNQQIADVLGLTVQGLINWRKQKTVTAQGMVSLLFKVQKKAAERAESQAIRPIVEFFKLSPVESKRGAQIEIFSVKEPGGTEHPNLLGLRTELEGHKGVYIFHDSRGRALYAGKTSRQRLWSEINKAYNRYREVQRIRRVGHPERRQEFLTLDEKPRQITLRSVPLYDLAAYLSAYHVSDGLIKELEALIIRGFANDLLNVKMENFS